MVGQRRLHGRGIVPHSLVEPSVSVNRKVRVPDGGMAATLMPSLFP
jgi:hypothetical protein